MAWALVGAAGVGVHAATGPPAAGPASAGVSGGAWAGRGEWRSNFKTMVLRTQSTDANERGRS